MKKVKNSLPFWQSLAKILRASAPSPAQASAWLALLTFAFLTGAALMGRDRLIAQDDGIYTSSDPTYLSAEDRGLYTMIDHAQTAGDYAKADDLIAQLKNRGLVGYVLAERYTSGRYAAHAEELEAWLKHYGDQPQAPRIASIAALHKVKVSLPAQPEPLKGYGSGDNLGRSGMPDSWYSAISHWRTGEISVAAETFNKLARNESLNDWQQAAAHYWAARAATRLGNTASAYTHLTHAAESTTTFYGMLAAVQLGQSLPEPEAPEVSDSLRRNPRAIRASLLAQMDRKDEAEIELRNLYGALTEAKRPGLVTLASELNLPNLQMRLGRMKSLSKSEALFARFPAPQYMVALDPIMDSALVMAVARNESAFHEEARNGSSGAMGLMQMLPSTARAVERRVGETLLSEASLTERSGDLSARLNNPALSARYGAEYLRLLAQEPVIDHNLVYLLIGYNAGSGTMANWKAAAHNINDPLLFIESIPYAETRNYVMQVLAQYWIYKAAMDEKATSLQALSHDQWPTLKN